MNKSNSGLDNNIPAFSVLTFILLMCVIILNCTSAKNLNEETTILGTDQKSEQFIGSDSTTTTTSTKDLDLDDHFGIWQKSEGKVSAFYGDDPGAGHWHLCLCEHKHPGAATDEQHCE